jgi:hypothetical protein
MPEAHSTEDVANLPNEKQVSYRRSRVSGWSASQRFGAMYAVSAWSIDAMSAPLPKYHHRGSPTTTHRSCLMIQSPINVSRTEGMLRFSS